MKLRLLAVAAAIITATGVVIATEPTASAQTESVHQSGVFTWAPTGGVNTSFQDPGADGGLAAELKNNTTGTLVTTTTATTTNVRVRAKGGACPTNPATWPNMRITVNGTVVANQPVNSAAWADYNFAVNAPAGSTTVQIAFTNEHQAWWLWTLVCQRKLFVDKAALVFGGETPTSTSTTPTTTTTTTPTTTTPPPPVSGGLPPGSEYVAMGDSYSSGWGADRTAAGPDPTATPYDGCGRNNKSQNKLLAAEHGWTLVDVSCGGANTKNFTTSGQNGEPPQLNALGTNTKLITATIGGNDASLMYILEVCVKGSVLPVPQPCVSTNTSGLWFAPASYIKQMNDKIAKLQSLIEPVLRIMVTRAPNATIRIAGYPNIVAPPGQPVGTCSSWLSTSEQLMFADALARTNQEIKDAVLVVAAQNPSRNIAYVDPLAAGSPFNPADNMCSSAPTRYMNGFDGKNGYAHPNVIGSELYADLYDGSLS